MRAALASLALAALPFGELPSQAVDERATCLRATGVAGELIRQNFEQVQVLGAGPGGVTDAGTLPAAGIAGCARVAARANGTGVLAFVARTGDEAQATVHAYLRDAARGWTDAGVVASPPERDAGAPASEYTFTLGDPYDSGVAVAASQRGDALVAVTGLTPRRRAGVVVARRAPGAGFGAPVTLFSARSAAGTPPTVAAGLSAYGEAVVAWAAQPARAVATRDLWAVIAPLGGSFGPPRRIGTLRLGASFALAVGDDGRALLAFAAAGGDHLVLAEREPGDTFGAPVPVGRAGPGAGVLTAAALRPDGAAVIAWSGFADEGTRAAVRAGPGRFAAPVVLTPRLTLDRGAFARSERALEQLLVGSGAELGASGARPDDAGGNPRAVIMPDGRALVTWSGARETAGMWSSGPHAAIVTPLAVHRLGSELRDASSVTPVVLADGRPGVAWTDNDPRDETGRVHLAIEGAPESADPPPPRVRARAVGRRVLGPDDPLRVRVTCSAACDVRAQLPGIIDSMAKLSLEAAGAGEIELGSDLHPIAPLRTGPVKVLLRYGAPGARHARSRTLTVRLRRRPGDLIPDVRGLSARRSGSAVIVRWRMTRPTDPSTIVVLATGKDGEPVAISGSGGAPQSRYELRLEHAAGARRVTVFVGGRLATGLERTSTRVRR